jgi:3-hydroxyacyl-CoA dehydrogenase/enoyl-CoA hydratase/3-hydroxybutyryl-CoA epimerase
MKMENYKHWVVERDEKDILWLGFDRENESVNSIDNEVLEELNSVIQEIQQSKASGLIIHSLKETGFIAGADINQFTKFDDPSVAIDFIRKGQAVFDKLESLAMPTVAMIDGFCMGGGTELALACDYRIASNEDKTRIGLPEVLLGIHPGWGGTVRLPKLIGGFDALSKVILTGSGLRASKAKKIGMIDEAVAKRQLKRAAIYYVENKPQKHQASWIGRLSNQSLVRKVLASLMRKQLAKKIRKEHYPAPYAVVDNWERDGGFGARAQILEADSIETLITRSNTAENLIRAYFLREKMKAFSKASDFKASHVHVIGAGVMGGDIAAWCALRGLNVSLEDRAYENIAPAIKRAHALFKKRLKKPRLIQAAMDRLSPDVKGYGVRKADVVIEAVFENLEVKQEIFKKVEALAPKHAILATNTSSIPLDEINQTMKSPERLIGIHFFNPVAMMQLVEVVKGDKSDDKIVSDGCSFVGQIGRLALPVKSSPGFLVNRVLMPYLMECVALLEEGYSGEEIDEAAKAFGMMMGPVELADTVGLDVCLAVAKNLTAHYGGKIPDRLQQMVDAGELGKKTNKGFYQYKKGKPIKNAVKSTTQGKDLANRLILRMVNESAACLRENVVESDDLLDAGMIFGAGFAPFRGGPMNYAHNFGEGQLNELFHQLESRYGERFKADAGLK